MATLKIKYLRGAITLFALCLIGTASAAPNGNGDEKEEKKEVKTDNSKKSATNETWYFTGGNPELAESYSNDPADQVQCGTAFQQICEIEAPNDNGSPDMSATVGDKTVLGHIQDAVAALPSTTPPPFNPVVSAYRAN